MLLNENTPDRRFALRRRQILAAPTLLSQPRVEEIAQEVSLIALLASRIADNADAAHDPFGIDQGRRDKARDLLAPVFASLTEGFDTQDLKEAKTLLERL